MRQVIAGHQGERRRAGCTTFGQRGAEKTEHGFRCARVCQVVLDLRQLGHKLAVAVVDAVTAFGNGQIPLALDATHPEHFTVNTVADLRSLRKGVNNDLGVLISVISWLLLALACLSAATSMYLTVQTRRSEIALRRALGMSRSSIGRMFIFYGLLVGLGGGLAGGALGVLGVLAFCLSQQWTPVLGPEAVWTGVAAGAATGVLSALYPAIAASKADPAQAIRA